MKKNKLLLLSLILGLLLTVVLTFLMMSLLSPSEGIIQEIFNAGIFYMVRTYFVVVCFAVLFNGLGWSFNNNILALIGGVMYIIAMSIFPSYFFFTLIQSVLSFIAFIMMRKEVQTINSSPNDTKL